MSIDMHLFEIIELEYVDNKTESKKIFDDIGLAKEFIRNATEKPVSIASVTYFVKLMLSNQGSAISCEPKERFAEHKFTPDEFLKLSTNWTEKTRDGANKEINSYMEKHYGSKVQS